MSSMNDHGNSITDAISDNEIIVRVLNGEKNLYGVIVRRYNEKLYRVGISIIGDDVEVEEAMQSAYIKAYEHLGKFAFKASFSTWLIRILINECYAVLKGRKHSCLWNEDMAQNERYQQETMDVRTPVVKMLNSELKIILEQAINELPEKYRTVFIMREIENMNVAETQSCLNISEVNVKVRLNRAKAILKNSLNGYYKNEDIFHFHLSRCDKMVESVMKRIKEL